MMQLSPLNFFGIAARGQMGVVEDEQTKARRRIEEVVMYRCPECHELHEWRDDAEDCCNEEKEAADQGAGTDCPVCGEKYATHRDASDCCLWKDIDALTRWAIADAVEDGSDWATELGLTPNAKLRGAEPLAAERPSLSAGLERGDNLPADETDCTERSRWGLTFDLTGCEAVRLKEWLGVTLNDANNRRD